MNPFRQARRAKRDRRDQARMEIRREIEPVPDVRCTQCSDQPIMEYDRQLSQPVLGASEAVIEVQWECPACEGLAYGYVTRDGLTNVLDNARPVDDTDA